MKPADVTRQRRDDLRWLLGDPRGRRFVSRLLDDAGLHAAAHQGASTNAAFHLEGKRTVGLALLDEIKGLDPLRYAEMVREQMQALADANHDQRRPAPEDNDG
jgi:hypothetical protein